ncbi:MAG TPA: hypothetical protein VHC90_00820 [Bryobacteraceae bacterium]|nr:hypothetical protein [Bryobacteraceae bacterium]
MQSTGTTGIPAVTQAKQDLAKSPARRVPVHISGADVPDFPCELVGVEAGTLLIRAERQIPETSGVMVSLNQVKLSGVVAECHPAEHEWMLSIALSSRKRRLDERIPSGQEAAIGVVENGRAKLRTCTIVDTSAFGMGLRLAFPLNPGARVCVETESLMIFGEIRHCNPKLNGDHIAGMLIVDVVPDVSRQSPFSIMLNNLRWKLASSIRGRDAAPQR